jgi:hypothetical protein
MLTIDFINDANRLIERFEHPVSFLGLLELLYETQCVALSFLPVIASNNQKSAQATSDFQQTYVGLKAATVKFRPKLVFSECERLSSLLKELDVSCRSDSFKSLLAQLERFDIQYQEYVDHYRLTDAMNLAHIGANLHVQIQAIKDGVRYAVAQLDGSDVELGGELESMEIRFDADLIVSNIAQRLDALDKIYRELCALFRVSVSEYPLKILKIESGSLLLRIAGFKAVVRFLVSAIEQISAFVHRNYTSEGKFSGLRLRADALDDLVSLSVRLKEHDIDIKDMNDEIRKGAVALAQEFTNLLRDQNSIGINGKKVLLANDPATGRAIGMELKHSGSVSGPDVDDGTA